MNHIQGYLVHTGSYIKIGYRYFQIEIFIDHFCTCANQSGQRVCNFKFADMGKSEHCLPGGGHP